jgi:hypothetical protein
VALVAEDYIEPTNEQLANFMTVYAARIPLLSHLAISPAILEYIFENQPEHREACLRHHRAFQEAITDLSQKIRAGLLQCEHIRPNGKQCPNYNVPGSHFCGLHQDEEDS